MNDYGRRAHQDLIVTRGAGFRKEKNKKKRGSYKGGEITVRTCLIMYESLTKDRVSCRVTVLSLLTEETLEEWVYDIGMMVFPSDLYLSNSSNFSSQWRADAMAYALIEIRTL